MGVSVTRLFLVEVHSHLIDEFEPQFALIARDMLSSIRGLETIEIQRPIIDGEAQFMMISKWKSLQELKAFAGETWETAIIPDHMKKFAKHSDVFHFQNMKF